MLNHIFGALRAPAALLPLSALLLAACNVLPSSASTDTGGTAKVRTGPGPCNPKASVPASPAGLSQSVLCVATPRGPHALVVEVAATPEQQQKGLMFRTAMADDAGMIFPFERPKLASFWMKNTVISLDLIFILPDGTVSSVAANAEPYSLTPIFARDTVSAVLELRAGRAAELGITPGTRISWSGN